MSRPQEWKMIHLLYQYARKKDGSPNSVLTEDELEATGVHCDHGSRQVLEDAEIKVDIRVDYPEFFVVKPFGQPWSNYVCINLFRVSWGTDSDRTPGKTDNVAGLHSYN